MINVQYPRSCHGHKKIGVAIPCRWCPQWYGSEIGGFWTTNNHYSGVDELMNDLWGPETLRISLLTPRLKTYFMSYILSTLPISSQRPYSKKLWPLPKGFPPGAVATGHPKMEWAKRQSQGFPPPGFYASAGRTCLPLASKIDWVWHKGKKAVKAIIVKLFAPV